MITPKRKLTRQVKVRGIAIGGGAPVVIQSMTNTDACDIQATLALIAAILIVHAQKGRSKKQ